MDYSPPIKMWLEVDCGKVDVAEVGPDFLAVRSTEPTVPRQATLHICVDGNDTQTEIYLPQGLSGEAGAEQKFEVMKPVAA